MSAGVHAETIKGTFVVGEEWGNSKTKISELAKISPGNPCSPVKMGPSMTTEHVVCDCRRRAVSLEKVLGPEWEPGFSRCKLTDHCLSSHSSSYPA